jgi:outer membrane protein TolC
MKKTLLSITAAFIILFAAPSLAQESILKDINYSDLEKYIVLAKQNYTSKKIAVAKVEAVKTAIPMTQLSYLDILNASYFYRPEKNTVLDPVNPYNVNGFQFGVSLNVGAFLQKPYQVKRAKADYKIAQLEAEQTDVLIEMEVKRRYYEYIQQIGQLKISIQAAQDNAGVAESLRYKFEKSEITLDAYNQSRINQSTANSAKIQAEVNYLKSKDLLEEMIGKKLSDVK